MSIQNSGFLKFRVLFEVPSSRVPFPERDFASAARSGATARAPAPRPAAAMATDERMGVVRKTFEKNDLIIRAEIGKVRARAL